jgi:hypothetical protein
MSSSTLPYKVKIFETIGELWLTLFMFKIEVKKKIKRLVDPIRVMAVYGIRRDLDTTVICRKVPPEL